MIALTLDDWGDGYARRAGLRARYARTTDPATSQRAAKRAALRAGSQCTLLLRQYAKAGDVGLAAWEAGDMSGLSSRQGCCYWRRCTDLRDMGFIADTDETRLSPAGERQGVRVITAAGWSALMNMGGEG